MTSPSLCEEQTFSTVYDQDSEKIRNFLYYKSGDLQQAEDLMQDVFTKLWRKCKDVSFETVTGFLFKAANNLFLDQVRQNKVVLKFEKSQNISQKPDDPYFQLRTEEFKTQLESAISSLPDNQREAFLMNRIDKMTFKEIAQTLEVSQTSVERRVSQALSTLKDTIVELENLKI